MKNIQPLLFKPLHGLSIILLFLFSWLLPINHAQASHVLGGEIAFRCVGNGQYVFQVYIYRACDGISFTNTLLNLQHNVPGLPTNIQCDRIRVRDVSPDCAGTSLNCGADPTTGNGAIGAVAQILFQSAPVDFSAVPAAPASGYLFHTIVTGAGNIACCRNSNNNTNCGNSDMSLRSIMYPYFLNGVAQTPAQLCDRSPFFAEPPTALGVVNPTDTAYFNNNAIDRDLDELKYFVDFPWRNPNTLCAYTGTFNLNTPFPGIIPYPDGTAISQLDGSMIYRPTNQGNYVIAIRVESYREGQKIAEVYRDFQLTFIPAPPGYPANQLRPRISEPFPIIPGTAFDGYYNRYYAGDTVSFAISAIDTAPFNPPQLVKMFFNGLQFGENYVDEANGCPYPPCATLSNASGNPPIPITNKGDTIGYGYQGLIVTNAEFNWKTNCDNIPIGFDGQRITDFQFVVSAMDNQCPAPGKTIRVVNINLIPTPIVMPSDIRFTSISPEGNNGTRISWRYFESDADPIDTFNLRRIYGNPAQSLSEIFMDGRTDSTIADSIAAYVSIPRRKKSFQEALLFRSNSPNGPFTQIAQFTEFTDNNYIDTGLDLANNTYYYRIRVRSGCFNTLSDPSDIVTYIEPSGTYDVNTGFVSMIWNRIWVDNQNLQFPFDSDNLYRIQEFNNGAWVEVATATDTFANFRTLACDELAKFRIVVNNIERPADFTVSKVAEILIFDNVPPPAVELMQATIDQNSNQIVLNWQASTALDVEFYTIYKFNNNITPPGYQQIGTVTAPLVTFTDMNSDPALQHYYRVAATDFCGNQGLLGNIHANMGFSLVDNRCDGQMEVRWTNYVGSNISKYEVFRNIGGTIEALVYTSTSSNDTFFVDPVSNPGEEYCYNVIAFDENGGSISTTLKLCKVAGLVVDPTFTYLRKATVQENGSVLLQLIVDPNADLIYYLVERSQDGVNFGVIGQVGFNNFEPIPNTPYVQISYVDNSAVTDLTSYYYRLVAVNDCEQITPFVSNTARTIFLRGTAELNFDNPLTWNEYESFLGQVATYNIFRRIPINEAFYRPLVGLVAPATTHIDNIIDEVDNDGQYCYFVEAIENNFGNPYGILDTVYSNKMCVIQEPRMFIPTAFAPDGIYNPKFYPQGVFIKSNEGYNLTIWDRLGNLVFESSDINDGWDGSRNGNKLMNGVYVYVLTFTGNNGQLYNKRGVVTLIR